MDAVESYLGGEEERPCVYVAVAVAEASFWVSLRCQLNIGTNVISLACYSVLRKRNVQMGQPTNSAYAFIGRAIIFWNIHF